MIDVVLYKSLFLLIKPTKKYVEALFQRQGGDEIFEDGSKTEDDHHLHPKPKPKITEDRRPKISYICILRLQIQRHEK